MSNNMSGSQQGYVPQRGYIPQSDHGQSASFGAVPPRAPQPQSKLLIFAIVGLGLVMLLGVLIWALIPKNSLTPIPDTKPTTTTTKPVPTIVPAPSKGGATPAPTKTTPTPVPAPSPTGVPINVGNGVAFVVPAGWALESQTEDSAIITSDAGDRISVLVGKGALGTDPLMLARTTCDEIQQVFASGASIDGPKLIDTRRPKGKAAAFTIVGTMSSGGSSQALGVVDATIVRTADGLTIHVLGMFDPTMDAGEISNIWGDVTGQVISTALK